MESDNNQDWPNLKRYEDENLSLDIQRKRKKSCVYGRLNYRRMVKSSIQITLKKDPILIEV